MDYSLRGYLEQRSTEELDVILNFAVNNYEYEAGETVRTIIAILEERELGIKRDYTPRYRTWWKRWLQKAKQLLTR